MARIVTYSIIMAVMSAIASLAGLHTGSNMLLTAFGYGADPSIAVIIGTLTAIFIAGTAVGTITIGLFTRQTTESSLMAPMALTLATMSIADMAGIMTYFNAICPSGSGCSFVANIVGILYFALIVGYVISIVQWWRGNDI